ncbi:ABC transporter ATP-binding protein [Sedimentisphaera salicampi]|uniref:ABC transporter ATP-binding protein n=1 Tax=Sedimentisphaera salicampi TaxID=1941349 RepID=UPI000B9A8FC6
MAMSETVASVNNLTSGYFGQTVLENVSFDVHRGEIFIILGGSGCGKSTLLKHMIGLYKPYSGNVLIMGEDISAAGEQDFKNLVKYFGVMYQNGALFGSMNVLENLRLPLEIYTALPKELMNEICISKLSLVGLETSYNLMPSELSGGMKKRAAIARAMVLDPDILFLDEPGAGLDPITSAELDNLILTLSRKTGITFIVVSHELDSIFTIADRVIMLDKSVKGIIAEGSPEELKNNSQNPLVQNFFNRIAATAKE